MDSRFFTCTDFPTTESRSPKMTLGRPSPMQQYEYTSYREHIYQISVKSIASYII